MAKWTIILSPLAIGHFNDLQPKQRQIIAHAIDRMHDNPFIGDVKALQGKEWKGRYRKRVGRFRIIFIPYQKILHIKISAIVMRSEQTYW
ncbi:MAG: hypothetical protein UY09_C0051G0004 [Parcubacteria group bacterium GW2011_GWA2_47_8]|nr:MAG: hypothetical protein UY09_C0051G0004 [Parcubacteria group bacterium GW2011_GWA2_47_8]OHB20600.1 MAG: hypothetical protein A2666_04640 [Parcubacteria group bacterium RIFCSPHIGHO2_01_FULL_47_10b]